jgi:hypothetical protein
LKEQKPTFAKTEIHFQAFIPITAKVVAAMAYAGIKQTPKATGFPVK